MPINYLNVLQENDRRLKSLYEDYDPVMGIGSPVPRFKFRINKNTAIWLPEEMRGTEWMKTFLEYRHLEFACKSIFGSHDKVPELLCEINKERIVYDFEFWAATCVKIQDKLTKELIPFKLNRAQRKLLKRYELKRLAGEPIRVILLKARQWGGSTLTQLYMAWIQLFHKTRWHSAVVTDVEDQAKNIRGMYKLMAEMHPKEILEIDMKPFEGSSKNKQIAGRDCALAIGSMQQPDNLRSFDFAMLHASEVGLWKATKGKQPKDLVQAIRSTIPNVALSMVVLESTAKGVGNYFHKEWLDAFNGISGYDPVFVAWYEIEMYQLELPKKGGKMAFIDSMKPYDWFLWESGATLEGINWYRTHKKNENLDDWRMQSEFPTNSLEAFSSTGRRAFAPLYVNSARKYNRKPDFIGEIIADAQSGVDALLNIRLEPNSAGSLMIWEPSVERKKKIKNRFVVPVDIGGRTSVADFSIIRVIDRSPILYGGVPETILTWKGHLDQDLVIWKAVQIAKMHDDALLVPESNSLRTTVSESEGDHIITILDEIKDIYSNIYSRTDPEKVRQGAPIKYGFHTNVKTKVALIDNTNKLLRDDGYIETDARVCDEYDVYEMKTDGSYGAVEGQHDDLVMCTSIGLKVSDEMDIPVEITEKQTATRKRTITEASF